MLNKSKIVLFFILSLGLFLRLYGNNWDQGWHLHPDERFLTMVGVDVRIPSSLTQYLDQHTSSFNPVNKGHSFYVYGTLPILLNKVFAQYFYSDTYDQFNLQGRVLSGMADFLVMLVIYKLVELVEKIVKFSRSIKYLSIFFYAISVLPIQLSHFFAVDTFLNLFCWLSLYYAIKWSLQKKNKSTFNLCLSGLFLGFAFACKISAIYFAPLIGLIILIGIIASLNSSVHHPRMAKEKMSHSERSEESSEWNERKRGILFMFIGLACFILFTYLALRIGSPYYFETNNIFNPQLSTVFISSIQTLQSFDNPAILFPPANQWIHASPFLPIINIIFFGVGPFYFLLAAIGFFMLLKQKRHILVPLILLYVMGFTVYQSLQFAKTMRYLIFIYPFLAIFAAIGMSFIFNKFKKISNRFVYLFICLFVYLSVLVWPVAFMSIYTKDHSRVVASRWIYDTVQSESTILSEYWDDPLPLTVQDPRTRNYVGKEVHIFDPDTKEKWQIINDQLKSADYYIMSSNRGWGSIPKTPERYPIASKFYQNMFEGKNGFSLIKEFSSYPSLRYLGIPIDFPDQWAEESFTVYDHPLVKIFKKQ